MFKNLGIFVIIRSWWWLVQFVEMCSLVKKKQIDWKSCSAFFASFFSMLSSVVLVDCLFFICRCENGRGVFPFVVVGCVVWVGGLRDCCHGRLCVSIVSVSCVSRWFLVLVFCCHSFLSHCGGLSSCAGMFFVVTHVSVMLGYGFREFGEGYAPFRGVWRVRAWAIHAAADDDFG